MEAGDDRLAWRAHDVIIRPWSRMEMGARVVEDAVDYDGLVARGGRGVGGAGKCSRCLSLVALKIPGLGNGRCIL